MLKVSAPAIFRICLIALVTIHFFGVIGIASSYKELFLRTTPLVLLISTFFLFLNFSSLSKRLVILFFLCAAIGYLAEVTGVQTAYLFGSYYYGENLGFKVFGVPLTIAINWATLCIASASVMSQLKMPKMLQIILAAVIPVAIDMLIEPLCSQLDFWHWTSGEVPLFNYITWLAFSLLFCAVYLLSQSRLDNPFAKYYLLVQVIFFGVLNLLL
ncbi:MAG: carotenoid biosynthesis protein [Bacteroidota bacterium]